MKKSCKFRIISNNENGCATPHYTLTDYISTNNKIQITSKDSNKSLICLSL